MSDNLGQKILDKIKNTHLEPKPRWHFLLKNRLVWTAGIVTLLIGAVAMSVIFYLVNNQDLALYKQVDSSFISWFLLSLPYFWIFFLALFIYLLYYNIKHTKKGYRYHPLLLISSAILLSILLGALFSTLGMGKYIDSVLSQRAPLYNRVFNPHINMWSQPERGRLAGLIVLKQDNQHFILLDRDQGQWQVIHGGQADHLVKVGQVIKLIGRIEAQNEFQAQELMIMQPGREFFIRMHTPFESGNIERGPGFKLNNASSPEREALIIILREIQQQEPDLLVDLLEDYPELTPILMHLN
jgi:heme/copper-type cytochrome/quinol oxidase subunit 2